MQLWLSISPNISISQLQKSDCRSHWSGFVQLQTWCFGTGVSCLGCSGGRSCMRPTHTMWRFRTCRVGTLSRTFDFLNQHRTMFRRLDNINPAVGPLLDAIFSTGERFVHINGMRRLKASPGYILHGLAATLGLLQTAQATNARDKVFAALAVSQEPTMVTVDYEVNVEDISISTSRTWIEQRKSLEILSYCVESSHKRAGLPSWAVD
jgi:hypothetical protein